MAKILNIITDPNQNLRLRSKEIPLESVDSQEIQEFILDMKETMLKRDGVGLAAPQVDRPIRLIIVNTKNGPIAMINPEITVKSFLKVWAEEGCLSVPFKFGQVKRHKNLRCQYLDETGKKKAIEATGLMARIIQHEIDHLDGILFIDKAKKIRVFKPES